MHGTFDVPQGFQKPPAYVLSPNRAWLSGTMLI